MPWQRDAVDVALELDEHGHYWYGLVVVKVPRQAGKTTVEGDVADHRCLTTRRGRAWYTAQTGKDASAWMRDEHFAGLAAADAFGRPGSPSCRYKLSRRAGQEGVEWPLTGSTFRAFAPLRDALHGKQTDVAFVDEAWSLSASQGADVRQAIRPTMLTRKGSQLWIVSTEGDDSSIFLDEYSALALASLGDPEARVALIDYGIPEDADPEDLELVAAHHPAYGHTIGMDALKAARDDFGDDVAGWARAYGNRPTRSTVAAIAPAVWAAAAAPRPAIPDRAGIALDVSPDGRLFALAAAWPEADDELHVETIARGPVDRGTAALVAAACRARRTGLVLDRASLGALELVDEVAKVAPALDVRYLSTAEYGAACATFVRGITDRTIRHHNDPDLDRAVEVAVRRPLGDGGFGWGRKGSTGPIVDLVASTIAVRAAALLPSPRRLRVLSATSTQAL